MVTMTLGLRLDHGVEVFVSERMMDDAFEVIRSCDDPLVSFVSGDTFCDVDIQTKLKLRKDFVASLSAHMAREIMRQLRKLDTHNGYPIEE